MYLNQAWEVHVTSYICFFLLLNETLVLWNVQSMTIILIELFFNLYIYIYNRSHWISTVRKRHAMSTCPGLRTRGSWSWGRVEVSTRAAARTQDAQLPKYLAQRRVKNSTESRPRATPLHTKVASRSASTSPYQISLPTPAPTHPPRQAPACVSMLAQACDVRRVINFT